MTTLRTLVTSSLRLLNAVQAGEAPSDDDIDVGVQALNGILDSWSTERLFIYTVKPSYFTLEANKRDYTLGPGGDFDVPRALRIEQATYALDSSVPGEFDLPLAIVPTDQYTLIRQKDMASTYPQVLYDNGDSPLRTLSFYPIPTKNTPVTLWLWQPLIQTTELDQEFTLPPGYERALRFTLAIELSAEFGKEITPSLLQIATSSVSKIKRLNSANQLPLMSPGSFGTQNNGRINWITGGMT